MFITLQYYAMYFPVSKVPCQHSLLMPQHRTTQCSQVLCQHSLLMPQHNKCSINRTTQCHNSQASEFAKIYKYKHVHTTR